MAVTCTNRSCLEERREKISGIKDISFKDRFDLGYFCPDNYEGVCFTLDWVKKYVDVDWPFLLLAIASGYLDDVVSEYAFDVLEEDSSEEIVELALMKYDEYPNYRLQDACISKIIEGIDVEEWALAFEKLYYAVYCWLYYCADIEALDESYFLQNPEDNFFYLETNNEAYDTEECEDEECTGRYKGLKLSWKQFIRREKRKLAGADYHDKNRERDLKAVLVAWELYGRNYDIPDIVLRNRLFERRK